MATRFERQLEELHVQMITMGSLCEKAISFSSKAIQGEGLSFAKEVFDTDISSLSQEICARFQQL